MKSLKFIPALLLCAVAVAFTGPSTKDHWKQLFNGKDLSGWDTYIGPDRRFKQTGTPAEFPDGRRRDDVSGDLGAASGDNLSQEELNSMIAPQKAAL